MIDFEVRKKIDAAGKLLIKYVKDKPKVVPVPAMEPASHGGGSIKINQTKMEPVTLVKFLGLEKEGQAFLQFLIWFKNWENHIVDYEEKSRYNLLMSHLDLEAMKKLIRLNCDYPKAMEKLKRYYSKVKKVVQA